MDKNTTLTVENLSKKFCRTLKRSLYYGTLDITKSMLGIKYDTSSLRKAEFWAIKNINFSLKRGDTLGVIGLNGSGKSTLLRLITGIYPPDTGSITYKGRIGALIAVGAGFHPHMTGKENIYLNGTILGMSRKEINSKVDEIIEFADIGDFLEAPVSTYSSGMRVRLGFSIAVHSNPDILLVDEVLAVGDAGFRIKAFNAITKLMSNSTVVFVSHSMPLVSRVCNKLLLMKNGFIDYYGYDIAEGIERYMDMFLGEVAAIEYNDYCAIHSIELYNEDQVYIEDNNKMPAIKYLDNMRVIIDLEVDRRFESFLIMLQFTDKDMKIVAQYLSNQFQEMFRNEGERMKININIDDCPLTNGEYSVTIFVSSPDNRTSRLEHLAVYRHYLKFKVSGLSNILYSPILFKGTWNKLV